MIEAVDQSFSTAFTEPSLTDLVCFVLDHRFADPVGYKRISAVHGKICRQCIVTIDNDLHIRNLFHHFFQDVHGDIDLTITVQLVTEQIGHNHIIRFDPCEHMSCGCLIHLDTGIIRIQFSAESCPQHKGCHNSVQHVGTGMIADDLFPLCLKSCTEHVIGCGLSVGSAYYKYFFSYLGRKLFQDIRTDLHRDLTGPGHTLPSHKLTDVSCDLCCHHSNGCSYFHNLLIPLFLFLLPQIFRCQKISTDSLCALRNVSSGLITVIDRINIQTDPFFFEDLLRFF